jgi:hypothetical protein
MLHAVAVLLCLSRYGYKNRSKVAVIPFGTGMYFTEFSLDVQMQSGPPSPPSATDAETNLASPDAETNLASPDAETNLASPAADDAGSIVVGGAQTEFAVGQTSAATYSVVVTNKGTVASRCRVVLFVRPVAVDPAAPTPLPIKSIVTFGGTPVLAPGAVHQLTLDVSLDSLSMTDAGGKRAAYKGSYQVDFTIGNGTDVTKQLTLGQTTVLDQLPLPAPMPLPALARN